MRREAEAYNNSIYLMVGMPYVLLAGVGCLVYRGLRRKARAEQEALRLPEDPQTGPTASRPPTDASGD
jgi:hypothetical protein